LQAVTLGIVEYRK